MSLGEGRLRLNFKVSQGIAGGFRVIFPEHALQWHVRKHGSKRPELLRQDFLDDVIQAMEYPDAVYPSIKLSRFTGKVVYRKKCFVFYKKKVDRSILFNGNPLVSYIKVVVKRTRRMLIIITPLMSSRINEQRFINPVTSI